MPRKSKDTVAVLGIDIGKNIFHLIGLNKRGAIVLRQKLSRGQLEARLANLPPCLIGMEACVGAHHLSRKLKALGHDPRLMPAKYVKAFLKGNKNDFRDAEAIAEAVQRPTMRFVATKTAEQLDLQALHRVRSRLVGERTAIVNEIRAFLLDRGIAVAKGLHRLRAALPDILATRTDVLSPRLLHIIEDLVGDWRRLDERIDNVSLEIEALAQEDAGCERLMTVPGIGPIISSATVAAIGTGDVFCQGPRLRRLARPGAQADLDRGSHHPRQDLQARQQVPADAVRAGRPRRAAEARQLGALRPQALDRGGRQAAAPQRAGDRARQQARAHRLERAASRPQLRGQENVRSGRPNPRERWRRARCCQGQALRVALNRASLDSLCARRPRHPAVGAGESLRRGRTRKWT